MYPQYFLARPFERGQSARFQEQNLRRGPAVQATSGPGANASARRFYWARTFDGFMGQRFWTRAGVKGALLRGNRLLLLRRRDDSDIWPGLWDLPGGGVEKEDTLEGALLREFREETGFRVRVGPVMDVSLQWVPVRAEPPFPSLASCFRCSTRSRGPPRLDRSEHSEFAWVTRRDLKGLAAVPYQRRAMERALIACG